MIRNIRADTKQIRLLDVLSGQLKSLVDEGQPDLDSLLTSLKSENLVSGAEYDYLKSKYLDTVSLLLYREVKERF
jgi:hypothetical protein